MKDIHRWSFGGSLVGLAVGSAWVLEAAENRATLALKGVVVCFTSYLQVLFLPLTLAAAGAVAGTLLGVALAARRYSLSHAREGIRS